MLFRFMPRVDLDHPPPLIYPVPIEPLVLSSMLFLRTRFHPDILDSHDALLPPKIMENQRAGSFEPPPSSLRIQAPDH